MNNVVTLAAFAAAKLRPYVVLFDAIEVDDEAKAQTQHETVYGTSHDDAICKLTRDRSEKGLGTYAPQVARAYWIKD